MKEALSRSKQYDEDGRAEGKNSVLCFLAGVAADVFRNKLFDFLDYFAVVLSLGDCQQLVYSGMELT